MRGSGFLRESLARAIGAIATVVVAALAASCDRQFAQPASAADALRPPEAPLAASSGRDAKAPATPQVTPGLEAISDAAITARVKSEIRRDPALAGTDISVNTTRGVVELAGSVASHEQAAEAAAHAQSPDGVMRVDTRLSVNPP